MRAGLVEVRALAPKPMELSYGRARFGGRHAADPADCADLLDETAGNDNPPGLLAPSDDREC